MVWGNISQLQYLWWLILSVNLTGIKESLIAGKTVFLGVPVRMFLGKISTWIYRPVKKKIHPPQCGWSSYNHPTRAATWLRAQTGQPGRDVNSSSPSLPPPPFLPLFLSLPPSLLELSHSSSGVWSLSSFSVFQQLFWFSGLQRWAESCPQLLSSHETPSVCETSQSRQSEPIPFKSTLPCIYRCLSDGSSISIEKLD